MNLLSKKAFSRSGGLFLAFCGVVAVLAQQPVREYIRLGGRVIAIETTIVDTSGLTVTPTVMPVAASGTSGLPNQVSISTANGTAWTATASQPWVRIAILTTPTCPGPIAGQSAPGMGQGILCVAVDANTGASRTATIRVSLTTSTSVYKDVQVQQNAAGVGTIDPLASDVSLDVSNCTLAPCTDLQLAATATSVFAEITPKSGTVVSPTATWTVSIPSTINWLTAVVVNVNQGCPAPGTGQAVTGTGAQRVCFYASANSGLSERSRFRCL